MIKHFQHLVSKKTKTKIKKNSIGGLHHNALYHAILEHQDVLP